jgi:hypothetical protein
MNVAFFSQVVRRRGKAASSRIISKQDIDGKSLINKTFHLSDRGAGIEPKSRFIHHTARPLRAFNQTAFKYSSIYIAVVRSDFHECGESLHRKMKIIFARYKGALYLACWRNLFGNQCLTNVITAISSIECSNKFTCHWFLPRINNSLLYAYLEYLDRSMRVDYRFALLGLFKFREYADGKSRYQ